MARKEEKPIINTVEYLYIGSDKQFNEFIKAVIRDYVSDDKIAPDTDKTNDKSKVKIA